MHDCSKKLKQRRAAKRQAKDALKSPSCIAKKGWNQPSRIHYFMWFNDAGTIIMAIVTLVTYPVFSKYSQR
ncbi:hypothetical protein MLD38_028989 [Melastoma candidum]|uniref:Uncharacterized protein n=1 Tax=Melastoma candidum TaxID=119954 RepID=A0ACB9N491_9MYRT|nr:hypothetical protein MLD38_028989 [Melastoma candidum]